MGNSVIWYFPDGADRTARIDFGRRLTGFRGPFPSYPQTVQESLNRTQSSVIYSGGSRISLGHIWTRGTRDASGDGDLLRRKLVSLVANLQRGGTCVFALDEAVAHAGFALDLPSSEASSLTLDRDLMMNIAGGTDADGLECWVNSDHDRYLVEHKLITTQVGLTFTLAQNIATDMSNERWVLLREYGTYPALRLPAELRESIEAVSHDADRIFTLDLPLEEDPVTLDNYWLSGVSIPGTDPGPDPLTDDDLQDSGIPVYEWKG